MELQEIHQLIDKYLAGKATEEERSRLEQWYEQIDGQDAGFNGEHLAALKSEMKLNVISGINNAGYQTIILKPVKDTSRIFLRWIAAAVLLIITGIAFYATSPFAAKFRSEYLASHQQDISPGGNNAVLTLDDGSSVVLNQAADGEIYQHKNVVLNKEEDGLLVYNNIPPSAKAENMVYNKITTPKGGKYAIVLSDGTKVWLNAASSLKYPTVFGSKHREVTLTGEAYFEVAKNAAIPFRVIGKGQTIEVLGTHFNVTNYPDESSIKTTLLEGSVKVIGNEHEALLRPGQQSSITGTDSNIRINSVNTEEAVAWKNGFFQFENASIQDIMNQISRWYNIDVIYQGKISSDNYKGKVRRDVNVSEVLKILETSGINFKIEGKTIIVK